MRIITTTGIREVFLVMRYSQNASVDYKVILTNEQTKQDIEIDVDDWLPSDTDSNMGQLKFTVTQDFNEGDEYRIKVVNKDNDVVCHRNKLFITDQVPQNYNING